MSKGYFNEKAVKTFDTYLRKDPPRRRKDSSHLVCLRWLLQNEHHHLDKETKDELDILYIDNLGKVSSTLPNS